MAHEPTELVGIDGFDVQPIAAYVEAERFCEQCGYNLTGQVVRLDPRTGIPMVRCPECGRYWPASDLATAGRRWLNRLGTFLLGLWVLLLVLGMLAVTATLWGSLCAIYYEWRHASGMEAVWGHTMFAAIMALGAFLVAMLNRVFTPHWSRWGCTALALAWPVVSFGLTWLVMYIDYMHRPERVWEALGFALPYTILVVLFGVIGVFLGRPAARGMIRMLLPLRVRVVLAYLWTVDGLDAPRYQPSRRDLSSASRTRDDAAGPTETTP